MLRLIKKQLPLFALLVWSGASLTLRAQQTVGDSGTSGRLRQQTDTTDCPLMYVGFHYVDSLSYCVVQKTPDSCIVKGYNRRNQLLVEYATIPQNSSYKRGLYREYYASGNVKGYGRFDMNVETASWVWRDRDGKDSTIYKVIDGQRTYTRKSIVYYRMDRDSVFHDTDMKAQFKGGPVALEKYIASNLIYPEESFDGPCEVLFIVNKEGKISNLRFIKRVSPEADQLVVDFIRSMPPWLPGTVMGRPVSSTVTLTVNFFMGKREVEKSRSRWSR